MTALNQGPNGPQPEIQVMPPLARAWLVVGVITFGIAVLVAYKVSFDGPVAVAVTVLPLLLAVAMAVAFSAPLRGWSHSIQLGATLLTTGCWSILMFDDTNWWILTFALYALCFPIGQVSGIALAAVVSLIWTLSLVIGEGPGWVLIGPVAALAIGAVLSITLWSVREQNATQAVLIADLQAAQNDLANAEREKGVLEERARFAAEIHDTLAQGFTSIVLLSRAAQRSEQWRDRMAAIEETAENNLQAARRLVAALGPAELDHASLPDALERQIATTLQTGIEAEFRLVGEPRSLSGTLKITILRAAQEALLNVRTHSRATEVHATLTYLDNLVVLDVRDNGIGFKPGMTTDRGALTGGQGLRALEHRADTLGGKLTIEAKEGSGTALSLQLPAPPS